MQNRKCFKLVIRAALVCLALVGVVFYLWDEEEDAQNRRKIHFVGSMAAVVQVQKSFQYRFKVAASDPSFINEKVHYSLGASSQPLPAGITLDDSGLLQGVVEPEDAAVGDNSQAGVVQTFVVTVNAKVIDLELGSTEAQTSFTLVATQAGVGLLLHLTVGLFCLSHMKKPKAALNLRTET